MTSKAYLTLSLDENLKPVGVDVKSESAWGLTRFYEPRQRFPSDTQVQAAVVVR